MISCLDLEGVLVPEIWINVAEKTGIAELRRTTRDEPDYDKLMKGRIKILHDHKLKLVDIQNVIATMQPLPGAKEFLGWLKSECQVIILSDTFYEFAAPLMKQLEYPSLFCHSLVVDDRGMIKNYKLRMPDQKKESVLALKKLNFHVIATGDSYNDIAMLQAADRGILFRPPGNVVKEFPQFPVTKTYDELKQEFLRCRSELKK